MGRERAGRYRICGSALLAWREFKKMTQEQLAKDAGVSVDRISAAENDPEARFYSRNILRIARALGIPDVWITPDMATTPNQVPAAIKMLVAGGARSEVVARQYARVLLSTMSVALVAVSVTLNMSGHPRWALAGAMLGFLFGGLSLWLMRGVKLATYIAVGLMAANAVAAVTDVVAIRNTMLLEDRAATQFVLGIQGTVRLLETGKTEKVEVKPGSVLPSAPFRLKDVILVDNKDVRDADLVRFKGCKALEMLSLDGTAVTDKGMENFEGVTTLTHLGLDRTRVTNNGLSYFKDCTNLAYLGLFGDPDVARVDDNGLKHFSRCKGLVRVMLAYTRVTNKGLEMFKDSSNLAEIHLAGTKVDDDGLQLFYNCKQLKLIGLEKTKVTREGKDKLQMALPNCKIIWSE